MVEGNGSKLLYILIMMMNNKFANSETILRAINETDEEFETGPSELDCSGMALRHQMILYNGTGLPKDLYHCFYGDAKQIAAATMP